MKASLAIIGTKDTEHVCLYIGRHDTEDEDDIYFHRALIRQFQRQGWVIQASLTFTVRNP